MSTLLTVTRPMTEWRLAAEHEEAEQWSCHQSRDTVTGHQAAPSPSAVLQCAACQSHHQPHHAATIQTRPVTAPPTAHSACGDRAISKCNLLLRKDKKMKMTKLVPHRATERQGAVQPAAATAALIAPWKLLLHPDPGFWCPSQMLICLPFTRT